MESNCKCESYTTKMLGDGCDECNPSFALEVAYDAINELQAEIKEMQECMALAIRTGDWAVDGACDPDAFLTEEQKKFAYGDGNG